MTVTLKYIITDSGAVLFNEAVTHSQVAKGFKKIHSAGFIALRRGSFVEAYGRSESLNMDSQPEKDKKVIEDILSPASGIRYGLLDIKELYKKKRRNATGA